MFSINSIFHPSTQKVSEEIVIKSIDTMTTAQIDSIYNDVIKINENINKLIDKSLEDNKILDSTLKNQYH